MSSLEQYFSDKRAEMEVLEPLESDWSAIQSALAEEEGPARRPGRWWLAVAAAAALLVLALVRVGGAEEAGSGPASSLSIGDRFPELMLDDQYGAATPLSSLQGKVVLVEFWTSYSKVCTDAQCYYFKPIYEQYAQHGFEIYGISLDTNTQDWLDATVRDGLPWVNVHTFLAGEAGLEKRVLLESLPTTFLLDQNGVILARDVGAAELEEQVRQALARGAKASPNR